jgi:hypothetical protein
VSGSNASLNSLTVTSGITGSLLGTASFARTASYLNQLNQAVIVTGSYNLQASTGQNLFFNSSGQIGSSGTGTHITISPSTNVTSFGQVVSINNGMNVTPGANQATLGLGVTVGAYPAATIARFSSGSVTALAISGSGMTGTGSFNYSGNINATSFTGSLLGTASFAVSASWAPGGTVFPFTGSAHITGSLTITGSLSQGFTSSASGLYSHAEGVNNRAIGYGTHAEGYLTRAYGESSHAEGWLASTSGSYSHAEGYFTQASGSASHAEGVQTRTLGDFSHAEGNGTQANGYGAHAEGSVTYANGGGAHAEGSGTYADADVSHTEGQKTATMDTGAHAEGLFTTAGGIRLRNAATSSGDYFTQTEVYVQGDVLSQYPNSAVAGAYIHFQVQYTTTPPAPTDDPYDVVNTTILSSSYDSGTNITTLTIPTMSNYASLDALSGAATYVFLENQEESQTWNTFYGSNAHAEGYFTTATGRYSHAEGGESKALGLSSHAEGAGTIAYGTGSHAEGVGSTTGRNDAYLIDSTSSPINGITEIIVNSKYGNITSSLAAGNYIQYYETTGLGYAPALISSSIWTTPNTVINVYGPNLSGYTGGSIAYATSTSTGDYETGGNGAHAEGSYNQSYNDYSHAEGRTNFAIGQYSHAEGRSNIAYGDGSHAEGNQNETRGVFSHAEGFNTIAYAFNSHTEGEGTLAGGWGLQTPEVISGAFILEQAGDVTSYFTNGVEIVLHDINTLIASEPTAYVFTVDYSTWDGNKTVVTLTDTSLTLASKCIIGIYGQPQAFSWIEETYGNASHATGVSSVTIGNYSYVAGDNNIALGWKQHVVGKFNQTSSKAGAFIIGNGAEGVGRNNLMLAYDNRVEVTGSVMATMGFTGSLLGTASYVTNAATASFLLGSVASASFATTAATASFLLGSVASATSASVVSITNNVSTNATYYPTFVSSTSGHQQIQVDSSNLTWNPSTDTLTAANFAGNASTSTTASFAATARTIYNASPAETQNDNYILFNSPNQNAYNTAATDSTLVFNPTSVTLSARNFRSTTSLTVSGSTILSGSTSMFGNVNISGSTIVSGSLRGVVMLPTITTNTASLDFSKANFFTCSLANGVTTHVSASNYLPGQTINMLIVQGSAGTGKVSFPAAFKSGSLYTGSAVANAVDIVTFITFDTTNIYLSAIRNLK